VANSDNIFHPGEVPGKEGKGQGVIVRQEEEEGE